MFAVGIRTRPLIAVLSRIPLFIEALAATFEGIADVQGVAADNAEVSGLVRAYRPDVVVAEPDVADSVDPLFPCVRIDLRAHELAVRDDGSWQRLEVELSPEAIRNVVVARIYGGEVA